MTIPLGKLRSVTRSEITVEVVSRTDVDGRVESTINTFRRGAPQSSHGPYHEHISIEQALTLVAVMNRLQGE